jgi:LysM repeat protein
MVGRNPARYLAPIALAATVAGAYLIVNDHVGGGSAKHAVAQPDKGTSRLRRRYARTTSYTVHPGDNLIRIAAKTGVSLATLEQLNPSLDPNTLQAGQRIRLRR